MSDTPLDSQLSFNFDEVDITVPCLDKGPKALQITEAKIQSNKDNTGHNLFVEFKTLDEYPTVQGGSLPAGQTLRRWYALQQSENPKAPDFRRDLVLLCKAALGDSVSGFSTAIVPQLINTKVIGTTRVVEDTQYGQQAEVRGIKAMSA